jgi:glycosyltransferase involved in cell wall biosynthesis
VAIPVYNGEAYLAQTIESILGQTFRDLELIVSDNGSTDRTREIVASYAARDARVRVVRSEQNRGAAWNYRRSFELACGEYRWAPASDSSRDSVAAGVAALDANPDAVLYPRPISSTAGEGDSPYDDNLDLRSPDPAERLGGRCSRSVS